MAINENLIGEVRPSESAVDRLRKRNRIRPWESSLVDAHTKTKTESEGVGIPPPGQTTERVCEPEGKDQPEPNANENPVGNSPSGPATQRADYLLGAGNRPAFEQGLHDYPEMPTGEDALGANDPVGELLSGSRTEGNLPNGLNASEAIHPMGESTISVLPSPEPIAYLTQRAADPGGELPPGRDPFGSRPQSVTGFDPTPFVPSDKGAISWREKGSGELRIPHRLYEFAHRVTSTRNELLVFDCLLRFSLGFHRSWCEAGYSFIASWTGISDITNIKKSLRTLLSAGIVVKTKDHDSATNSGSIYEVPVVKGYLEFLEKKKSALPYDETAKNAVGNLPTGYSNQRGERPSAGRRETYGPVGDLPPKKENLNKIPKKTLSQDAAEELDAYVDQVKPASKRESEIFFLGKLLPEYPSHDVAIALNYVRRFGVLGSKEECHSPLKYLSTAIEQVLPKAREYRSLLKRNDERDHSEESSQQRSEKDSIEASHRNTALSEFETGATQEEQDRFLAEVTVENSVMGYAPPLCVLRGMAALKWFDEQNRQELKRGIKL